MNTVAFTARLGNTPELRHTSNTQTPVTDFRVAIPDSRDRDAQPTWITVKAFGKLAETLAQHLTKGRHVAVSGRLVANTWTDTDGSRHERTEVIADTVDFLDSPKAVDADDDGDDTSS